ncbi:MAG TPA: alpha-ketoglutarate-dependent dioxygenase AlkB [Chitinophagales bacterium]|nr:alpha-ketoglutarate-dependent dioxygenase AlkB [Chitinophagales bacterium]
MSLFPLNPTENLLPFDGTVHYFGKIISFEEANHYYNILFKTIEWRNDEAVIFGKHIITPRKVAWYADVNFSYTYSNTTKQALAWTTELLELKHLTENLTNEKYNSCLLNLYHNGNEGMAYHSDAETALRKNGAIASLSFGAERKFSFKHKTNNQTVSLLLEHGSLLVMKDATQANWLHRLPPTTKINTPRINLTFRQMMV